MSGFLLMSAFLAPAQTGYFLLINWTKRNLLKKKALLYSMSLSAIDAVLNLCNILVESNNHLCKQIQKGGIDEENLYNHFKNTAKTIKKYSKFIESHGSLSTEPHGSLSTESGCKDEKKEENDEEDYDKLISRIEKIKQDRQNDKKGSVMDDENDELIGRLKRLKPVELVEEPESDIYEILDQEEEEERKKDECYEERERQDQLNRIEPDKSDPEYKFEELNNYANELLLNRKRMKKQEFIKKLDIYMIIMRKKLINESEKCTELNKIITSFKHKLQERRKIPVEVIKLMLQWVKESSE